MARECSARFKHGRTRRTAAAPMARPKSVNKVAREARNKVEDSAGEYGGVAQASSLPSTRDAEKRVFS